MQTMNIDSRLLLQAADMLRKLIPSKPLLPIMECIHVSQSSPESLLLTATDGENTLSIVCPATEITDFRPVCLPCGYLADAMRILPEQVVTIQVDDAMQVTLTHFMGEVSFMAQPADEFPRIETMDGKDGFTVPLDRLMELCRTMPLFAASDELRPVLGGAIIEVDTQGLVCAASDGHRLMKVTMSDVTAPSRCSILIPKRVFSLLMQWQKRGSLPVSVRSDGRDVVFEIEGLTLRSRLIEGRFPNYNSVIPQHNDKHLTVGRDELMRAIGGVATFGSRASSLIALRADRSNLRVEAEDLDFSTRAHIDMKAEADFDATFRIGFKSDYLHTLLAQFPCPEVTLELTDPTRACVIRHSDEESHTDRLALLMPLMLTD